MTAQLQSHLYATHLNHRFAPLELVDVPGLVAACRDRWYNRGDVCRYTFKAPDKKLILMRDSATAILNSLTIAPITSTIRSIPTELVLTREDGMPDTCAANLDNLQTVPKSNIGNRIARLTARKMREAHAAVSFALGFDDD